ncbi:MAG: carboxypeptidase-like regulatory domain-containing protein [Actinomycetota bacterium]|nr:carboxypeptidase-like regulatory domain-containing protein [Actinomycetota bacterium]
MKYGVNGKPAKAEKNERSAGKKFGSIAGTTVLDTTDTAGKAVTKPLGGVHLRLLNSKGKVVRATLSSRDGVFVFRNVKPNLDNALYTITAKSKRYTRVSTMTITVDVDKGKTTNIAAIHFKP